MIYFLVWLRYHCIVLRLKEQIAPPLKEKLPETIQYRSGDILTRIAKRRDAHILEFTFKPTNSAYVASKDIFVHFVDKMLEFLEKLYNSLNILRTAARCAFGSNFSLNRWRTNRCLALAFVGRDDAMNFEDRFGYAITTPFIILSSLSVVTSGLPLKEFEVKMSVSRYHLIVNEIKWGITDTRAMFCALILSLLTSPNNKKNIRFLDTTVCTVCIFKLWWTVYVLQMLSLYIMFWWWLTSGWWNL